MKKAAIELSVTAIIILILAIVVLGLGLGFIRGMFTKVATQFEQQIAAEPEPPSTSVADPLTLSREAIITNAGSTEVIKVGVMNPTSDRWGAESYGCPTFKTQPDCPNTASTVYNAPPYGCYWVPATPTVPAYCGGTFWQCTGFTGTTGNTPLSKCVNQPGCMLNDAGACANATGTAPKIKCTGMTIPGKANRKIISQGDSEVFNYIMEIPKATTEGTYLCEVNMKDYRKDLTVKITK